MVLSLLLCWFLISISYGIDRTQFSNFRATESHDSYLSFSSSFSFPLSLKWNVSNTSCTFSNGILNFAFTNKIFYCLTNEIWDLQKNTNSYIQAFDVNDGSTIWKTYIDVNTSKLLNKTAFDGVVAIPPNYLGIVDDNNGDLFILNGSDGNIIYNISIDPLCKKYTDIVCLESGITSSNKYKSIFIHYTTNEEKQYYYNGTLFQFDVENNKTYKMYAAEDIIPNPQIPTICNDDIIITTNLFGNASAFKIDETSGNLQNLWNYSMINNYGAIYFNPPLCIPRNDGGFNVLINSVLESPDFELWELLDGESGKLLKEIEWVEDSTGIPAVNVDKMIMIRTTLSTNKIIGYDISDINGNWTQLYDIKGDEYFDIMIIDENIFLCNNQVVDVYSVLNGTKIYSWTFPQEVGLTRLAASIDENGKPLVIVVAVLSFTPPNEQTILYALQ